MLVIVGSMGNIGRRLKAAWPDATGIDRTAGADIVANLATADWDSPELSSLLARADGLIHVATSANVDDPDAVHWRAVVDTARLVAACDHHNVRRLVLPSSDWAEPKTRWGEHDENAYGHSKRVIEAMAHMYNMTPGRRAVALRIGWVARNPAEVDNAPGWLRANYWDNERLVGQIQAALGD